MNDLRTLTEPLSLPSLSLIKDDPKVRREIEAYLVELEEGIDDRRLIPFSRHDFEIGVMDMPRRIDTGYYGIELETQRTNILEAFTSNGKTSLMRNCIQNMCNGSLNDTNGKKHIINRGRRMVGCILTFEETSMSIAIGLGQRAMNEKNSTDVSRVEFIERLKKDKLFLQECLTLLHDLFYRNLFIFDTRWTAEKLPMIYMKLIRQLAEEKLRLDFVWGDYVQKVPTKINFASRSEKLASVVDVLGEISKHNGIANIWNAQQNRPDGSSAKAAADEKYWLRLGKVTGAQEIEQNAAVVYAIVNRDAIKKQMGDDDGSGAYKDVQTCIVKKLKDTNGGGIGMSTELIWQPRIGSYYNVPRQTYQEAVSSIPAGADDEIL